MGDVRVHVERARPTCPFCKDDVAGGLVWVCPGCDASHHAACHDEHGACASCALAEPRAGASVATKGEAHERTEALALAPRRAELERLGFQLVRESADELVAMHPDWRYDGVLPAPKHTVFVRRVPHLTLARLHADGAKLDTDALASTFTLVIYLAERIDPDARRLIEQGRGVRRAAIGEPVFFPVAWDGSTDASYFRRGRLLGVVHYAGVRYLARRLLFPWLRPEAVTKGKVFLSLVAVLVLMTLAVAAIIVLAAT